MLTKNFTYSDKIFNHKFDNPVPFLHFIYNVWGRLQIKNKMVFSLPI